MANHRAQREEKSRLPILSTNRQRSEPKLNLEFAASLCFGLQLVSDRDSFWTATAGRPSDVYLFNVSKPSPAFGSRIGLPRVVSACSRHWCGL